MGLDASVMCTCWQEGKTKPPPCPVYLDEDGWLVPDVPNDDDSEQFMALHRWKQDACEHEGMHYVFERISNWSGYREFLEALEQIGWAYFPTLLDELPSENGGSTSPAAAAQCLDELEVFKELADSGENTFLINTETGEVVHSYVAAYDGVFIWDGREKLNIGIDPQGFFIRSSEDNRDLFRSMRFEQRFLADGRVEYFDADTEMRFVCKSVVSGKMIPWPDGSITDEQDRVRLEKPKLLHVEQRRLGDAYYDYIVEPLTTVFQAAVETGNPVRWC